MFLKPLIFLLVSCKIDIATSEMCRDILLEHQLTGVYFSAFTSKSLLWKTNNVTVSFINGNWSQHEMVKQFSSEWTPFSNIHFTFIKKPYEGEIRVSFYEHEGSWSVLGAKSKNSCYDITKGKWHSGKRGPSMNFASVDRATILHEFGHALGLRHEHQNPLGGIQWNLTAVNQHFSQPPHSWSVRQIHENIIRKYSHNMTNGVYDPMSIMHYEIDSGLTMNGCCGRKANDDLSEGDKKVIRELYKKFIPAITGHKHFEACRSGLYDVATTWCRQEIPTSSDIVSIPAHLTVKISALSRPEFFRIDIHGTLQVHIDSIFPPDHPLTISIFNSGLLTDTGKSYRKNQTIWRFPANSILFIYLGGRIRTELSISICNLNSSACTATFRRTDKSWTIVFTHLGQMGAFEGINLVATRTGNIKTASTWCGGQVPTVDICNKNGKCDLLILPNVTLTIDSAADQPLFNSIHTIDNRGVLAVAVPFRLISNQMDGSVHVIKGTPTLA